MDDWFHEHWEMVALGSAAGWAIIVFTWKSLTLKFVTKDQLKICREDVKMVDDDITTQIQKRFDDLGRKIDHLDDRRREDAIENSKEHSAIRHDITMMIKDIK